MPRMVAEVSLTWAQINECQFSRWIICIHAIYICISVEPPHWRALSMTMRIGSPRRLCSSMTAMALRCGRLSTKGTYCPVRLSRIFTHLRHQNAKSWRIRVMSFSIAVAPTRHSESADTSGGISSSQASSRSSSRARLRSLSMSAAIISPMRHRGAASPSRSISITVISLRFC